MDIEDRYESTNYVETKKGPIFLLDSVDPVAKTQKQSR
jgi:hypothetical protein